LLALGDVPYEHAKAMTADQIISLYHFDHGKLHALECDDSFWNLTPRLISAHREKSRRDTSIVAKVVRNEAAQQAFNKVLSALVEEKRKLREERRARSRWPKRTFASTSKRGSKATGKASPSR
jgi:hypothetical protein